jgi:hypothetical protein
LLSDILNFSRLKLGAWSWHRLTLRWTCIEVR